MEAQKTPSTPPEALPVVSAADLKEAERKARIARARRDVWADPQNLRVFAELAKR